MSSARAGLEICSWAKRLRNKRPIALKTTRWSDRGIDSVVDKVSLARITVSIVSLVLTATSKELEPYEWFRSLTHTLRIFSPCGMPYAATTPYLSGSLNQSRILSSFASVAEPSSGTGQGVICFPTTCLSSLLW